MRQWIDLLQATGDLFTLIAALANLTTAILNHRSRSASTPSSTEI